MRQRTLFAILSSFAHQCTYTKSDNSKQSGIIHTLCNKGLITIHKSSEEISLKTTSFENLISIECPEIHKLSKQKFKTDDEISKKNRVKKRELQEWEGEEGAPLNFDVKDYKTWDQFETNKQKFGVVSTYDENLYTTPVPNLSELTEEQVLRAKIVEKELGVCSLEKEEVELDEEAMFGAVLGSGRYGDLKKEKEKKKAKAKKKIEDGKEQKEGFKEVKRFTNSKKFQTAGKVEEPVVPVVASVASVASVEKEEVKQVCTSVFGVYVSAWGKLQAGK